MKFDIHDERNATHKNDQSVQCTLSSVKLKWKDIHRKKKTQNV